MHHKILPKSYAYFAIKTSVPESAFDIPCAVLNRFNCGDCPFRRTTYSPINFAHYMLSLVKMLCSERMGFAPKRSRYSELRSLIRSVGELGDLKGWVSDRM